MHSPRVLLVIYNPIIKSEGNKRLNQVMGWNNPDKLCAQYIADIEDVSYGYVKYQIVERIELDEFPPKVDGFRYTADSFLKAWRARSDFHQPDTTDYPTVLRQVNLAQKVEADQVDEMWMMGFPYCGFYESCMGGRGAVWCNGPVIPGTENVSRRFVVMGFNYERGVGEMLEDMGHRTESIMDHVFRDVPDMVVSGTGGQESEGSFFDKLLRAVGLREAAQAREAGPRRPQTIDLNGNLWKQFIRYDKTNPEMSSCGNVHFAPSSERDYDWGNARPVWSNADDWLNYPNVTGDCRIMDREDWGNGEIRAHHLWWLCRLPHVEGMTPTGRLNNWWDYTVGLRFE